MKVLTIPYILYIIVKKLKGWPFSLEYFSPVFVSQGVSEVGVFSDLWSINRVDSSLHFRLAGLVYYFGPPPSYVITFSFCNKKWINYASVLVNAVVYEQELAGTLCYGLTLDQAVTSLNTECSMFLEKGNVIKRSFICMQEIYYANTNNMNFNVFKCSSST